MSRNRGHAIHASNWSTFVRFVEALRGADLGILTASRYRQTNGYAHGAGDQHMSNLNFLTHQEIFNQAVGHLFGQGRAALLPRGGGAYRGYCGGCPVGSFIKPRDYMTAMEGIPVRYIGKSSDETPAYMDVGVAALKRALLRARINVYDPTTVELLSCLQNVHDVFGTWEWQERFTSIARQFGLSPDRVKSAA
jgi:hypothetical protein